MPFILIVLFIALLILVASLGVPLWVASRLWRYVRSAEGLPSRAGAPLRVIVLLVGLACLFVSGWLSNAVFGRAHFIAGTPSVNTAGAVALPVFIGASILGAGFLPLAVVWREQDRRQATLRMVVAVVVAGLMFVAGRQCLQEINQRRRQNLVAPRLT